jgi:hypothetical protein
MNEEFLNQGPAAMTVTEGMKNDLLSAAKWAKFLCIVGCVAVAIIVLLAIFMMFFGAMASKIFAGTPFGAAVGFLYLIVAALYIYPLIKGFQFANATKAACLSNDEQQLARGIAGLNDLLKYMGVLTIIVLSLYVIALIFGLGIAAIGLAAMS